ncbi:hypothetical protein Aspvir_005357 [Aspergillus viridinutans]|uniref:Coenzyme Q-binding protein COQ10 START domain-containing protein n=1 Tax=Aspergillus viridinutans TaxID=75553 RepID=A0A9P3BVE1_ASPVI|nr:uncharacterized protein Aspvir_005357 [Aspergillus viridinutans]GIK01323.1 hypothetical protein Aspvir_005357 [Aspergillus viridinutans]
MASTSASPSLSSNSTPNISASDAVLHLSSATHIDAPSQDVWNALIDTSTWPTWNTFVPRVTIREQPDSPDASPDSLSPILQKGTRMTFHVHMNPSSTKPQKANDTQLAVIEIEPPNPSAKKPGRIVWASDPNAKGGFPASLLTAERVHEIVEVEVPGEDGQMRRGTEVRNWEAQVGYLVYVVWWMFGGRLKENFEIWVRDLKGLGNVEYVLQLFQVYHLLGHLDVAQLNDDAVELQHKKTNIFPADVRVTEINFTEAGVVIP